MGNRSNISLVGNTTNGQNYGTGADIYIGKSGANLLQFKTISATGGSIQIIETPTQIFISGGTSQSLVGSGGTTVSLISGSTYIYSPPTDYVLDSGSTNPIANSAVTTVLNQILDVIAVAPTYSAPTAGLTPGITQTIEMGTTLSSFAADISFTQNDGGSANGYELCRNSVHYSSLQNNTMSEANITSSINYVGKVSYNCGPTKNNNLGIPDPAGKILAGTVSSAVRIITPVLRQFWGSTSVLPADSAAVRGLSNNNYATTNTFTLTTGTVNTVFAIAIPSTKSLVSVIDTTNLNLNVTSQYVLINGAFNVLDAGSNNQTYKLYAMQPAIPYNPSATHVITVS